MPHRVPHYSHPDASLLLAVGAEGVTQSTGREARSFNILCQRLQMLVSCRIPPWRMRPPLASSTSLRAAFIATLGMMRTLLSDFLESRRTVPAVRLISWSGVEPLQNLQMKAAPCSRRAPPAAESPFVRVLSRRAPCLRALLGAGSPSRRPPECLPAGIPPSGGLDCSIPVRVLRNARGREPLDASVRHPVAARGSPAPLVEPPSRPAAPPPNRLPPPAPVPAPCPAPA